MIEHVDSKRPSMGEVVKMLEEQSAEEEEDEAEVLSEDAYDDEGTYDDGNGGGDSSAGESEPMIIVGEASRLGELATHVPRAVLAQLLSGEVPNDGNNFETESERVVLVAQLSLEDITNVEYGASVADEYVLWRQNLQNLLVYLANTFARIVDICARFGGDVVSISSTRVVVVFPDTRLPTDQADVALSCGRCLEAEFDKDRTAVTCAICFGELRLMLIAPESSADRFFVPAGEVLRQASTVLNSTPVRRVGATAAIADLVARDGAFTATPVGDASGTYIMSGAARDIVSDTSVPQPMAVPSKVAQSAQAFLWALGRDQKLIQQRLIAGTGEIFHGSVCAVRVFGDSLLRVAKLLSTCCKCAATFDGLIVGCDAFGESTLLTIAFGVPPGAVVSIFQPKIRVIVAADARLRRCLPFAPRSLRSQWRKLCKGTVGDMLWAFRQARSLWGLLELEIAVRSFQFQMPTLVRCNWRRRIGEGYLLAF
jgi:hypothetical protein